MIYLHLAISWMEIQVEGLLWKLNKMGRGNKPLLALHGYGQDSTWFRHHAELLQESYTLYCIDLAYHGNHENFNAGLLFNSEYAESWMTAILDALNLEKIGLMGYSIGARVALSVAAWHPNLVSELWLMAPDGLPVSKTYKLLTGTLCGKLTFKSFIATPGFSLALISLFDKTKILNHKVANFYRTEIGSKRKRQKLFDTWMAYRKAKPDYSVLQQNMNKGILSVTCILGKEDRVIPFKKTRKFILKNLQGSGIIELDLGHNLLSDKGARLLEEFWK